MKKILVIACITSFLHINTKTAQESIKNEETINIKLLFKEIKNSREPRLINFKIIKNNENPET